MSHWRSSFQLLSSCFSRLFLTSGIYNLALFRFQLGLIIIISAYFGPAAAFARVPASCFPGYQASATTGG
ncbi:hypothetical protein GALMADRAFT_825526 [Galerina marginata CBS 339.88]|uniref:Uncharacterized protein n=1 Tax=Galerina marginata (strain CBS 339.88) TaxID=685588 RepID=A0A067TH12_GALM3|nr:hypothetical protein GALMADRAFT_825526 [Galerina marginata CBS 339.88]